MRASTLLRITAGCGVLALLLGCGRVSDLWVQADELTCSSDLEAPTEQSCGANQRGVVVQVCREGRVTSVCEDPDECVDDEERLGGDCSSDEGSGRAGHWRYRCVEGRFVEAACLFDVECLENTERLAEACGESGRWVERCDSRGKWTNTGRCEEEPCIEGGTRTLDRGCGQNGRGKVVERCENSMWTPSECDDTDVCVDGAEQQNDGCTRTCASGQWSPQTDCNFCGDLEREGRVEAQTNEDLEDLRGVTDFQGVLTIGGEVNDLSALESLMCAERVVISKSELFDLKGLERLRQARLEISNNSGLGDLVGLSGLLEGELLLARNSKLKALSGLDSLQSLTKLSVTGHPELQDLTGMSSLERVDELIVRDNPQTKLDASVPISGATRIELAGTFESLGDIEFPAHVESLTVDAPLVEMSALETVEVLDTANFRNAHFSDMTGLSRLQRGGQLNFLESTFETLQGLEAPTIENLILSGERLRDLTGLGGAKLSLAVSGGLGGWGDIEGVEISNLVLVRTGIDSFEPLSSQQLLSLYLDQNPVLESLEGIDPTRLEQIFISSTPLVSLEPLRGVKTLTSLSLVRLPETTSLSFLEDVEWVGSLGLFRMPWVDLSHLPEGPLEMDSFSATLCAFESLDGIERLNPRLSVSIESNEDLSECEVQEYFADLVANGYTGETHSFENGDCE